MTAWRCAGAQPVDDRQPGPRHAGQHGDRRQRRGDRRQADELPDDEQRQRRRRRRPRIAASTTGLNSGRGRRPPARAATAAATSGDGREQRQLAERGEPDERARPARGSPASARGPSAAATPTAASVAGSSAPVVTASAPTAHPPIDEVQPGQRQRPAEPLRAPSPTRPRTPSAAGDRVQRLAGAERIGRARPPGRPRTARAASRRAATAATAEAAHARPPADEHPTGRLNEHQCSIQAHRTRDRPTDRISGAVTAGASRTATSTTA